MGYEDIIRAGVALASTQFESMKLEVTHSAWVGEDGDGGDSFAAPVARRALVDLTKKQIFAQGRLILTFATITFLDPVPNTSATSGFTRENPIDPRDVLVLPDGSTAPIASAGGFADSGTLKPFALDVILGQVIRAN